MNNQTDHYPNLGKNIKYHSSIRLKLTRNLDNKNNSIQNKECKMSIQDVRMSSSSVTKEVLQQFFNEKYKFSGEPGMYRAEFKDQESSTMQKINPIDIAIVNSDIQQLIVYCESRQPHSDNLPNIFAAQTKFIQTYFYL